MSHNVEKSIEITVQANMAFWVDKDEWDAKSNEKKREEIMDAVNSINRDLDNDALRFKAGNLVLTIMEPGELKDIDLSKVETYDPGA